MRYSGEPSQLSLVILISFILFWCMEVFLVVKTPTKTECGEGNRHVTHMNTLPTFNYRREFVDDQQLSVAKKVQDIAMKIPFISTLAKLKKEHTWAVHVMHQLIRGDSKLHGYENFGDKPRHRNEDIPAGSSNSDPSIHTELDEGHDRKIDMLLYIHQGEIEMFGLDEQTESLLKHILAKKQEEGRISPRPSPNRQEEGGILSSSKLREIPPIFKKTPKIDSAIVVAAKNGIEEMVDEILNKWPVAIQDMDKDEKNLYIKNNVSSRLVRSNEDGKSPEEIFQETHETLASQGSEWFKKTSESHSVVAALVATVAFATASTVPGGTKEENGHPAFRVEGLFHLYSICSLLALCFSVVALVMFLSILTSRFQNKEFHRSLPTKLLCGMSSMFLAILFVLASFCSAHSLVLTYQIEHKVRPIYVSMFVPVTIFALMQLPLYVDLFRALFIPEPKLFWASL